MKSSYLALGLFLGGVLAIPVAEPQDFCFDCYDAIPIAPDAGAPFDLPSTTTTISYIPTAAASSAILAVSSALADPAATSDASATPTGDAAADADATKRNRIAKRDPCSPNAAGNGPTIHTPNDSVSSFYADSYISSAAVSAITPAGYSLSPGYVNLTSAVNNPQYLTFTTDPTTYDPSVCAAKCDSIAGCLSFNMYFERDPSQDPDDNLCPTPPSLTRIKCAFFGSMSTIDQAKNAGQWQSKFQVVIAGSNTYNKPPSAVPSFTGPIFLNNAAIMSPTADDSYMRVQTFPQTQPYDPSVCAAACNEMSAYNTRHANGSPPRICTFFNSYILYKNGANGVFTCTYYTQPYDPSFAKNTGQYRGSDHYTVQWSFSYSLN